MNPTVKGSIIGLVMAFISCACTLQVKDKRVDIGNGCKVEETIDNQSGSFRYKTDTNGTILIQKPFGSVGQQPVTTIPQKSKAYWERINLAESDILGAEYLKDPREPSYDRTANLLVPFQFPYTYLGMREYPNEVPIGWDGAIGLDPGFFFDGKEPLHGAYPDKTPYAVTFNLNGKPIQEDESLSLLRGQLDGYLPAIQYVYQRDSERAGWEQIVFAGELNGSPMLFARFRLCNYAEEEAELTFSISLPFNGQFINEQEHFIIDSPFRGEKNGKVFSTTFIPSEPFEMKDGQPQWSFTLPAGQSKDLYFAIPGYSKTDPALIEPQNIKNGFFQALLEQKQEWETFLSRGIQIDITESEVENIYKSALVKLMIAIDGNEPRGGAVHYEGYWPFCHIYVMETMLYLGYFEEAEWYLINFMSNRISPDGVFLFDQRQNRFQQFDMGRFLSFLSRYYNYTQDASLILQYQDAIDRVIGFIKRERQISMQKYPVNDSRHGLMAGIMSNDYSNSSKEYYYTTDAPICMGLLAYSKTLKDVAAKAQESELETKANALITYAETYHKMLRSSFETAVERDDKGKIAFIHIQPMLEGTPKPFLSRFRSNDKGPHDNINFKQRNHYRYHDRPRLMGSGFLNEEEIRSIFEYDRQYDQTILGVRRGTKGMDDFQAHSCEFQKLRLSMPRDYLMAYYAYLHYLIMPGGVGMEKVSPVPGEYAGRINDWKEGNIKETHIMGKDGAHATWPVCSMTSWIYLVDHPNEDAIYIARGIPTHWLEEGKKLSAKGLASKYGRIDYQAEYNPKEKKLTVEISPEENRSIPLVHIGIRVPGDGKAVSVKTETPEKTDFQLDSKNNLVSIKDLTKELRLIVTYEE